MSDRAFDACMDTLEEAHDRYVRTLRVLTSVLLDLGITPERAEEILGPIDETEAAQDAVRGLLRLLQETTA